MTPLNHLATLGNGRSINRSAVPMLSWDEFAGCIVDGVDAGRRVAAFFGVPCSGGKGVDLYIVLADDQASRLRVGMTTVEADGFASLTPRCPQVHLFEREIAEQFGLKPIGHPALKPVRFAPPLKAGAGGATLARPPIGLADFYRVEGDEVHEVAVGPVHAGIIEPGHFRFQCGGETVFHLEISLGYQHRGVERAMLGGPNKRSFHYAQTLAGDSTIAHGSAYCQIVEELGKGQASPRAQTLRGIALELERMANHVGDLGALAGDVGFLPTASYCGRIRGDFLNMTALICGNRFGRGLNRPGGVGFDIDAKTIEELLSRLSAAREDCHSAIELLWDAPSVMARFEDTGPLAREQAQEMGLVGVAARACGLQRDIRNDQPVGIYRFVHVPIATWNSGDVFARAYVRWLEVQRSLAFVEEQLSALPGGLPCSEVHQLAGDKMVVALTEGWRGEVCHVALTDEQGRFLRYKIVDPSFHNWMGLALSLRGQQISDFPLCNKSFNLSYCGHDL